MHAFVTKNQRRVGIFSISAYLGDMGWVILAEVMRWTARWASSARRDGIGSNLLVEHPEPKTPFPLMEHLVSEIQQASMMHKVHSAVHQLLPTMGLVRAATFTLAFFGMTHGFTLSMATSPGDRAMSRREAVSSIVAPTTFAGAMSHETCT